MFFYLLKNSTVIEPELNENSRNTKILIYGTIAYIILHATLFLGGDEALLNCLKPYFWLFVLLDLGILTMNSDIDIMGVINKNLNTNKLQNKNISVNNNERVKKPINDNIDNIFNQFLKNQDFDSDTEENLNLSELNNNGIVNSNIQSRKEKQNIGFGNPHIKRKNPIKKVRFQQPLEEEYVSSSDSDIGTDIDIDSFRESLTM